MYKLKLTKLKTRYMYSAHASTTKEYTKNTIAFKGSVSFLQTTPNPAKHYMNHRLVTCMLAVSVKFES